MKRTMKKAMSILAASAVLALTLAGCGNESTDPATTDGSDTDSASTVSGTVATNGSTSMEKVIGNLKEQFENDNDGNVTVSYDATGSGAGIEAVVNGTADIGLSSRALKEEETSSGLKGTTIALDGIAVIVNADSQVADLTVDQIAKIFTGEITNWSEVGGADGEIACIGREANSGTRDGFESITGTEDTCKLSQELTSTGAVIEAVKNSPNAIGYASLSAVEGKEGIKALTVNGVACSEETVLDGSYEIQRPFVLVTKSDASLSTAAQAFFDYATSKDASELIRNAGAELPMEKALNNSGPAAAKPGHRAKRAEPGRRGAKDALEWLMHTIFLLCGIVAVGFVLVISVYLIISGVPAMKEIGLTDFLLGQTWAPTASDPSYGILPFILTSIYGTAGAVLIGVPIGLMTAIYLAKVANPRMAAVIHTAVELLAGIPSVVYGLVGMIVLVPGIQKAFGLSSGACLLAAIVVLAIMILPSIISVSETSLRAVPEEYEQASLALGATHLETVFRVTLPAARSGVATAVVLGVGRAIGEAMAIIMVAGNVANMPGLFTSVRFLTTAIASEMSYASVGSLQRQALFSIGLVLFLFIMLINVFLNVCIKRKKEN